MDSEQQLRIMLDARKLELDLFWRRSLFFGGFISVALGGVITAYDRLPALALALSWFGLLCSFCWTLANRGSKYWYEAWEQLLQIHQKEAAGKVFDDASKQPSRSRWWSGRFSVSKLAIVLSDYVTTLWLVFVVYQLIRIASTSLAQCSTYAMYALAVLSLLYLPYVFFVTQRH